MRGRFPEPDALKDRRGNPGKRALGANDSDVPAPIDGEVTAPPAPVSFEPPAFLTQPREIEIFTKIIGKFLPAQIARETDFNAYARYSAYLARWVRAKEVLDSEAGGDGWYQVKSKHGERWARHPAAQDLLDFGAELSRLELQLGLTPLSRQSILRGLGALRGLGGGSGELPLDDDNRPPAPAAEQQRGPLGFLRVVKPDKKAG